MTIDKFIKEWKDTFTERIRLESKSKKIVFNFKDTLKYKNLRTDFDTLMIEYLEFMKKKPLQQNDYFKYVNAYLNTGKKLNPRFFRHDKEKLAQYYYKINDAKLFEEYYNPFNYNGYKKYVLYMMLKLKGQYIPSEHDDIFNVKPVDSRTDEKPDDRETNPCTNIPSVLRGLLPFEIIEYDISRAYPTFIFKDLGIKPFDVYSKIDKRKFNSLLNTHSGIKGATIEGIRAKLEPIYGSRVNDVITEQRFNTQGGLYYELTKIERYYIEKFVEANKVTNYVRLHDGVIMLSDVRCDTLVLDDIVEFKTKDFSLPTCELIPVNFYDFDDKGKPFTSPVSYMNFFEQEGFIRVSREGHDQMTVLQSNKKIVTPMNHNSDMASYLKEFINEEKREPLLNHIANDIRGKTTQGLKLLSPTPFKYHRDTSSAVDISFCNNIARITKDTRELISYDDIEGLFPKHKTQDHIISFTDKSDSLKSPFAQFLIMAATGKDYRKDKLTAKDKKVLGSFFSMFGYYISNHKMASCNYTGILTDLGANGINRDGGRGKSLILKALIYFRLAMERGAGEYNPDYRHVHDEITEAYSLLLLDDVELDFNWTKLYTNTTNGMTVIPKGGTAFFIPFETSVKVLATFNGAFRMDAKDKSSTRRFMEYKVTNFWQGKNPGAYFGGGDFFDTWNKDEWNDFYNFGFFCVQYFLKNGLQVINYDKKEDNFNAYFSQDSILEETTRILNSLKSHSQFSVTDFIKTHKNNDLYNYRPEFTIRNAKKYIDAYVEYKNLPFVYSQRLRRWEKKSQSVESVL